MSVALERDTDFLMHGNHFSCSMTAVLLARVHAYGGQEAVAEVLALAGSPRSAAFLSDIVNWVSYEEAVALWRAGAQVTRHPQFPRMVGEDAVRRLSGSPIAALLRSLGSPERVYGQIATTATKYSLASRLETLDVGPGFAELISIPADGFPRSADHCAWTCGLLTQPPILFGLAPGVVEHEECAALGADVCRYRVTWAEHEAHGDAESERNRALAGQLEAMKERLHSMFATASDLIGADDISDVLARITDRAAVEIRAPSYLLAIRTAPDGPILCHHRGIEDDEAMGYAETVLANHPAALPDSWLVVPVRSSRRDYGRLLALYDEDRAFFAEERGLLEVYARYAASALDSATALMQAEERYGQSSALLSLARAMADAGTSHEVAARLADAVPGVVDCDRVGVCIWDEERGVLVHSATTRPGPGVEPSGGKGWTWTPTPGSPLQSMIDDPHADPRYVDAHSGDEALRELSDKVGAAASMFVPLAAHDRLLGLLTVSVVEQPERLRPTRDLLDRLSGVAAQATTALQNGRLLDQITHQALHDDLTGLANRLHFKDRLARAVAQAAERDEQVTAFYLDLDAFKPVNDDFGHDSGDALLVDVARRLEGCTRPADLVARLGGDEFAVLIDSTATPQAVALVAGRLAAAFDEPFAVAGRRIAMRASIGRASFPRDAADAEQLLATADAAMFAAKRQGQAGRSPAPAAYNGVV
jgi:diguanylate cyclase (GGDEF)-like protein